MLWATGSEGYWIMDLGILQALETNIIIADQTDIT